MALNNNQDTLNESIVFTLPGQGEPYVTCNTFSSKAHLDYSANEFHIRPHFNDCGRFECPVCEGWKNDEALSIMDRLLAYKALTKRDVAHYVVSPSPQEIWSANYYRSLRKKAYRIAKKHGIRGGVWIFHYFRHPSVLNDKTEICPGNPHWHILGDGWAFPSHVKGWIVKNLGVRRSTAQIRSTVNYCLKWASKGISHIGDSFTPSKTKIEIETWTGVMSLKALKVEKFIGEGINCPVCGEMIPYKDWYDVVWLHGDPPDIESKIGVLDPAEADISIPFYYR